MGKNEELRIIERRLASTQAELAKVDAENQAFREGIADACKEHRPYVDEEDMRPGNSGRNVRFWCSECRTPWPCKMLNTLRRIYGEARDWEPATIPFEPLVMSLPKKEIPF